MEGRPRFADHFLAKTASEEVARSILPLFAPHGSAPLLRPKASPPRWEARNTTKIRPNKQTQQRATMLSE